MHKETHRKAISAANSDAAYVTLIKTQKIIQIVYAPPFFFTIYMRHNGKLISSWGKLSFRHFFLRPYMHIAQGKMTFAH